MDLMTIERTAENYALSTYLSKFETNSYDDVMESFMKDEVLDSVTIWQPFEDFDLIDLANYIEITRDDFLTFAVKIKED